MGQLCTLWQPDGMSAIKAEIQAGHDPWLSAMVKLKASSDHYSGHQPSVPATWYCPGVYQDPTGANAAMGPFIADCDAAYITALCGYLLDQRSPTAQNIVRKWTTINKGVSDYKGPKGNDSYLSLMTEGNGLVQAAIVLDTQIGQGWTDTDAAAARAWVRTVYVPTADNILGPQHMTNNWADWALFGKSLAAFYLADTALRDQTVTELQAHITHAIDPKTGLLPEEMARGDKAVNYAAFSLIPMISACEVLTAAGGTDLVKANELLLRKAVSTLQGMLDPLMKGQLPAYANAVDLYEHAGAVFVSNAYKGYARPSRPIQTTGQHLSLATTSTLTALRLPSILPPEPKPSQRHAHRRSTDTGPLDDEPVQRKRHVHDHQWERPVRKRHSNE